MQWKKKRKRKLDPLQLYMLKKHKTLFQVLSGRIQWLIRFEALSFLPLLRFPTYYTVLVKKGIFCSYRAVHFLLISKVLKMVKKEVWGEGSGTNSYQQPDLKLISEMKRLLSIFGVMYSEVNLSVGPMVRSQVLQRDMCSRDTNTIDIWT